MNNLGYYKVNNKIFFEKIEAILYANQTLSDIEWFFHDETFSKVDWTVEPTTSLDEFYRLRAQQIRDNYDYVIVMCSGGADSTNVVKSFLDNGIHVDEIVASAPISGLNNHVYNNKNTDAGNTMSETKYAQLPLLDEISTKYPNVKITLNDYFYDIVNYKTDEWIYKCGEWIHPTSASRYNLEKFTHIKNLAESGKRIGIVYGIDKPVIVQDEDNNIQYVMSDLAVNVPRPPFDIAYPNVEIVLFYWAAEMPLMMVKQSHVLTKWLYNPENARVKCYMRNNAVADYTTFEQNRLRHSVYERAIVPCIYPTTHRLIFQGQKPTRMFLGEHDDWFYKLHNNTKIYQQIESDFFHFIKNINEKYLNVPRTGFILCTTRYKIGTVDQFTGAQGQI